MRMLLLYFTKKSIWVKGIGKILAITICLSIGLPNELSHATPTRSLIDRVDDVLGAQIHLIYAIPRDSRDQNWDTNGQIKKWVDQSQDWLVSKVNRKFKYDSFQSDLDITFMRSTLDLSSMRKEYKALLPILMTEFLTQSPIRDYKISPKTYIFILSENIDASSCGIAQMFSAMGLIFTGGDCWSGPGDDQITPLGMAYPALALLHEAIHTFGAGHVCDSTSDLMWGKPECEGSAPYTSIDFDTDKRDYFGGDKAGVDIAQLPVWMDNKGSLPYARIKATEIYAPKSGLNFVFSIGEEKSTLWIEWERLGFVMVGGYQDCTLSNGQQTISAKIIENKCEFAIPLNWRGGVTATLTGKIWTGPYFGEVTEKINLWNPENQFQPCTSLYCFVGTSVLIESKYCYESDSKSFTFQQYVDGQWIDIATTKTRLTTKGCPKLSWEPIPVDHNFLKIEQFLYRYVEASTPTRLGFVEPPQSISILSKDADYPGTEGLKALREANARAEAKVAAELKAKQEADAKVAAELKAKQEADAKAAAELKAKQEADAKAAAELKAKQEAEAAAEKLIADAKAEAERILAKAAAEKLIADAKAEAERILAAAKAAATAKTTITCTKGKLIKKVTAVKPKCPAGYKVKR